MKLHRKGLVDEFGRVAAITAAIAGFTLLPVATATAQDDDTVEVESLQGNQAGDQEELNAVNEEATALGAIQITGSRLRRTDFETAQPVLVLTREDIERTGLVSIGDILQNIPQAGAALNTAFNNGGTGATEIDLRNLGSNRVLVLVNGRRWVGGVRSLNTSGVDLNTIPISIIESIEILKDGASAIYGSDAIAGVINIKTRRDFQGLELRGQYGVLTEKSTDEVTGDFNFKLSAQPDDDFTSGGPYTDPGAGERTGPLKFEDDGQTFTVNLSAGTVGRNSSAFIDVSYTKINEVFAGSRNVPSYPNVGPVLGSNVGGNFHSRGSLFTPGANLIFVPTDNNAAVFNAGQSTGQANDPNAICYPIIDVNDTINDETAGALGEGIDLGLSGVAGGVNLCVAETLQDGFPGQRGSRPDYGHQYVPFDFNLDGYNFAPINYLITPQERTSIFGQFSQQITRDITFTGELLYNNRRSVQQLAHQPLAVGDILAGTSFALGYVASDNPYNPTNPSSPYYIPGAQAQDIGLGDAGSGLIGFGGVLRRMIEGGPRVFSQDVNTMRIGGGLEGQFLWANRFFAWDGGLVFNESRQTDISEGEYDMQRVARALGPIANCVGTAAAPAPTDAVGCVPLNMFGPLGSVTQEMLDYVQTNTKDQDRARQGFGYFNVATEIEELAQYLDGPLGVAFGVEYRKEFFESIPDGAKIQGTNANLAEQPTKGSYDVKEAYMELGIPVIGGLPFVESVNLSVAGRFSEYGILDRTFTNVSHKFGLEYRPMPELLIRSTVSEAFRAPAITDLFLGQSTSFPSLNDPCSDYTNDPNPNVQQNCADDGVPSNFTEARSQLPSTFGGNPDLEPETADTISAGFVYSPDFIQDFNIAFDWYNVLVEDFITFPGAGTVLAACYSSDPNNRQLCEFVSRGPDGGITNIQNIAANIAEREVEGFDLNIDWRLPFDVLEPYGNFKFVVDVAYTTKLIQRSLSTDADGNPTTSEFNLAGLGFGTGAVPRSKINASLDWDLGAWNAAWAVRYIHSVSEFCDDGRGEAGRAQNPGVLANPTPVLSNEEAGLCDGGTRTIGGVELPINKIEAVFYHDVLLGYDFAKYNTSVTFGVRNLFNQNPPVHVAAFSSSYDPTLHDFEDSREMYFRFVKNF